MVAQSKMQDPNILLMAVNAKFQQAQTAFRVEQFDIARQACLEILRHAAGEPNALHLLGLIAHKSNQIDHAIAYLRRACISPHVPATAFSDIGEMLRQKGQAEEAETYVRKSISLNDKQPHAWNNLGVLLQHNVRSGEQRIERLKEARSCFDKAISLQPDYFEAYWNRGTLMLLQGKFEKAWADFEWRKRKQGHNLQIASSQPAWTGVEDISNKTILVHWEQGLGDTIQFCRYVEKLAEIAGKVLFWPQASLMGLMRQTDVGSATIVDFADKSISYDYHTPLMSLPVFLETSLETIPSKASYIKPDPARIEKWKSRIGSSGFKIGISWKGSSGPIDAGRSIPLTQFLPLLDIPGVRLISLQKFEGLYQLHNLPGSTPIETFGDDFDAGPDAFMDSAAVMDLCDLVITSDTAIAHLAGALGVRTWVALKQTPDWRWLLDCQDSPWYPSMRLYRQQYTNDWKSVFDEIGADIRRIMNSEPLPPSNYQKAVESKLPLPNKKAVAENVVIRADPIPEIPNPNINILLPLPQAPISWGEYIDKLTILEIKSTKISDKKALSNVLTELSQLNLAADKRWKTNTEILFYKTELRRINEALWQIEDDIREKEAKKEFDENFILLARSVYQQNDKRAAIKKAINNLTQSKIAEEKLYKAYP